MAEERAKRRDPALRDTGRGGHGWFGGGRRVDGATRVNWGSTRELGTGEGQSLATRWAAGSAEGEGGRSFYDASILRRTGSRGSEKFSPAKSGGWLFRYRCLARRVKRASSCGVAGVRGGAWVSQLKPALPHFLVGVGSVRIDLPATTGLIARPLVPDVLGVQGVMVFWVSQDHVSPRAPSSHCWGNDSPTQEPPTNCCGDKRRGSCPIGR